MTWIGIVGGAITVFANLQGVLNLADWAHWLATHWHEYTFVFWHWAFGWIGIKAGAGLMMPPLFFALVGFRRDRESNNPILDMVTL